MFLSGLNDSVFVYELSGCWIDCCSYLNFRYDTCFEQEAPWHSGNYRVQIHPKTRMWLDKNTQLKNFLSLRTVLLNHFVLKNAAELRYLRFYMLEQFQSRLVRSGSKRFLFIWSKKRFLVLKLFTSDQEKPCLTN